SALLRQTDPTAMKNRCKRTGRMGGMSMDAGSPRRETLREG
ncbi:MAG: hypothetical protein KBH07_11240, partial [Flavobacteriales bacterium]|nr:hypothetical protein [Flavobacteriales bacterium]